MVLCQEKVQVKSELFLITLHFLSSISWVLSDTLEAKHVVKAVEKAKKRRNVEKPLILHTEVMNIHNDYGALPYYKMSLCIQILIYRHGHNSLF